MALKASLFLSSIFICVIEVFSLAQTIIKIKYWNICVYDISVIWYMYITESIHTKKFDFTEQQICFLSLLP